MPTNIEWATETWNPIIGCSHASPGCDNCYAERMAKRLAGMGVYGYRKVVDESGWTGDISYNLDTLEKPLHWKKHRRIFVCSMGDLFHQDVGFSEIEEVFQAICACPQHTFMILTKRPDRMFNFMENHYTIPPENLGLGVTIETQDYIDRARILCEIPAAWRFVSAEPMLGPVASEHIKHLDWVICGGESGPGARPMHPDWARGLRDQCVVAGVPFFFKQWGEWWPSGKKIVDKADMVLFGREPMYRVGKHNAGHLLDGVEWRQIPECAK